MTLRPRLTAGLPVRGKVASWTRLALLSRCAAASTTRRTLNQRCGFVKLRASVSALSLPSGALDGSELRKALLPLPCMLPFRTPDTSRDTP